MWLQERELSVLIFTKTWNILLLKKKLGIGFKREGVILLDMFGKVFLGGGQRGSIVKMA